MARLTREEVVTIQTLAAKDVPQRAIARQLGVTDGTVRYHLRRCAAEAKDGRVDKLRKASEKAAVIAAWWEDKKASKERPPNVQELHEYLVSEYGYTGSYQSVRRYIRDQFGPAPRRTYRRVETPAGAQCQTDWGEYPRVNLGQGLESISAFVLVLSHCRMPSIIWSRRVDQVSWLHCHSESFQRLGGVPAVNRIDNVKTALSQGAGAWGTIHPTYRSYARVMRFHVDACAPRAPEAKGKSEAKVRLSRLLTPVVHREYAGLEGLQEATDERVMQWSKKAICPATGGTVFESWQEEKKYLGPLPSPLPEPFDVCVDRPVHKDCSVHFEGRQYPVPFRFVGRRVEVRGCAGKVQILHANQILREHPRHTAQRVITDPTCYEGEGPDHLIRPVPLGKMGQRLQELYETPVECRPVDLYAALAEVAR
jgi:transposase